MATRLTEREVLLVALDTHHNPGHVGSVDVFGPGSDGRNLGHLDLLDLIGERLSYVPRYRKRVLSVPGALAAPVWADDEAFDPHYHVRSSALPAPGSAEQLRDFVARVFSRRLDRKRPLWEVYLVEGLAGGRTALVWKTHPVLVDGIDAVDLGQVLLDNEPAAPGLAASEFHRDWSPEPEPGPVDLLAGAALETLRSGFELVPRLRHSATEALGAAVAITEAVGGTTGTIGDLLGALVHGGRPPIDSPLGGPSSEQRRWAGLGLDLEVLADLRGRARTDGGVTVNDIVLAVITGALRTWLHGRGDPPRRSHLVALAPTSVRDVGGLPSSLGSAVAPLLVSLPVGEPNPSMRLQQIAFGTRAHKDTGRAVGARDLTAIAGFAPGTLHALGVRSALDSRRRPYDLMITNVPGPQDPVYAGAAPLLASWPILPLAPGHLLTIGVTSYDGTAHLGLTADRDAVADLSSLAAALPVAVEELADALHNSGGDGAG